MSEENKVQLLFTPEPWVVSTIDASSRGVTGISVRYDGPDHQRHVATVFGQMDASAKLVSRHGYALANAQLISATPNLLSALEGLLACVDYGSSAEDWNLAKRKARVATAKSKHEKSLSRHADGAELNYGG